MATAVIIAAVGAAAAVAGTGYSIYQGQQQSKAQKNARNKQEQLQELQRRREIRQQVRQNRVKRASVISQAGSQGVGTSSGAQGGVSSLNAQLASNVGFTNQSASLGNSISGFQQQAANAQGLGQIGSGLASLGSYAFSNASTIGRSLGFGGGGTPYTINTTAQPIKSYG